MNLRTYTFYGNKKVINQLRRLLHFEGTKCPLYNNDDVCYQIVDTSANDYIYNLIANTLGLKLI